MTFAIINEHEEQSNSHDDRFTTHNHAEEKEARMMANNSQNKSGRGKSH